VQFCLDQRVQGIWVHPTADRPAAAWRSAGLAP
jgi:hypothetical protein